MLPAIKKVNHVKKGTNYAWGRQRKLFMLWVNCCAHYLKKWFQKPDLDYHQSKKSNYIFLYLTVPMKKEQKNIFFIQHLQSVMEQTVLISIKRFLFQNLVQMNCWFRKKIVSEEIEYTNLDTYPKETKINVFEVRHYFYISFKLERIGSPR